jgi:hypothetical protein
LFPLGLFYVSYGIVRATILGLMERPELAPVAEGTPDDSEPDPLPATRERRAPWRERRQMPEE